MLGDVPVPEERPLLEISFHVWRERGEEAVHRGGLVDLERLDVSDLSVKISGHVVGVPGQVEKEVIFEECEILRRNESHLGGELRHLLAQVQRSLSECSVEEDDQLTEQQAVLGAAERQHVDASFGRHLTKGVPIATQ